MSAAADARCKRAAQLREAARVRGALTPNIISKETRDFPSRAPRARTSHAHRPPPPAARRTYRAHGRINAYMSSPCHIELILSEREQAVKGEAVSAPALRAAGRGCSDAQAAVSAAAACSSPASDAHVACLCTHTYRPAGGGQAQAEPQGAGQEAAQRHQEQEQLGSAPPLALPAGGRTLGAAAGHCRRAAVAPRPPM